MNDNVKRLTDELLAIQAKKDEVENALKEMMKDVIREAGKENTHNIKRLGGKSFSVSSKEVFGKTWSPTYYDWESAVDPLVEYLEKQPIENWKQALQELLDKSVYGQVNLNKKYQYNSRTMTTNTPVDAEFIRRIIEKL
jgi:hypothetical protein